MNIKTTIKSIIIAIGVTYITTEASIQVQEKATTQPLPSQKKWVKKNEKEIKATVSKKDSEKEIYPWLQTYADIIALLEEKSYRAPDFAKYFQSSLKSAMASIDAHSNFFGQESFKAVKDATSGEFSGIGVSINGKNPEDDALSIIDIIEGGPASKVGLRPGDRILQVNGESLRGLTTDEVVTKLKGKIGTKVVLRVLRKKKKPMTFTITRDKVKDQTALCFCFTDHEIYYLSLKTFNELAAGQIEQLLKKANQGSCKGLILDLRRNPGGTMESAIDIASLFLTKGSLVVATKNNKGELKTEYRTKREPLLKADVPIFILIDNFTASASEILAGALRHHADKQTGSKNLRVFLVGTTTFGKGSVQELIPIKNECAIKVTTMLYYLPDDTSIQACGIQPDFVIKPKTVPEEDLKWVSELYGREASLKNHITKGEVFGASKEEPKKGTVQEKPVKGFWQKLFNGDSVEDEDLEDEDFNHDDDEYAEKQNPKDKRTPEEKQRDAIALDVQIQACVNMINMLRLAQSSAQHSVKNRLESISFLKKNYLTDTVTALKKVS